jgi:ATP-dependent exoDNAse (exonuclease V) beta subunit
MVDDLMPPDQSARDDIASRYHETLFVEAGAGSGKTQALVERVTNLISSSDEVSLNDLAVITFTNKAATELRHRIRSRMEELLVDCSEPVMQERLTTSLEQLDEAAISTLHGFARRLLTEHSIEAGLPPSFEVLDEIATQVEFLERFEKFLDSLLLDPEWSRTLLLGDALGINPARDLLPLATELHKSWDLLRPVISPEITDIQFEPLIAEGRSLARRKSTYLGSADSDGMTSCLDAIHEFVGELEAGFDEIQQLATLADTKLPSGKRKGQKNNWTDIESLRSDYERYRQKVASFKASLSDLTLRRLTSCLSAFILEGVREQRNQGRLDYHDLLVSARETLSHSVHGPSIRAEVRRRYKHLLIDEFQDTDPIQIEIATLIAAPSDIEPESSWHDTPTLPGGLFFVGDPKQSIYRFRRADIGLYLAAQKKYEAGQVRLSTNFRSTPEIVNWVNEVFGKLIHPRAGSQPAYAPLIPIRESAPVGDAITLLGATPHPKSTTKKSDAEEVRLSEAHDIAQTVIRIIQEGWSVKRDDDWREARFSDITVLVPTRSAMSNIQRGFENAGISYCVASASNVWRSQEIRDLIMCLRALNDPSNSLATVSALRSSVYGCGDDDLYNFRTSHSESWDWNALTLTEHLERAKNGDPVAAGLAHLAQLHEERSLLTPSELIGRIIRERQLEEQCSTRKQPRESLRRFRYVVDQARAWSDTANGNLQTFLSWVTQQTADNARPIETILSEDDDDSVQIMTIHAAKGLEFPITVVAGLPLQTRRESGVRVGHSPNSDLPEVKIRKEIETLNFDDWAQSETLFNHDESIRTLYVACTRARDHLVISLHRKETAPKSGPEHQTLAELLADASTDAEHTEVDHSNHSEVWVTEQASWSSLRPPLPEWHRRHVNVVEVSGRQRFMSATHIAQSANSSKSTPNGDEIQDPGLLKDSDESEILVQGRGRYGTAVGRAVHAVLQTVDLETGSGLANLARIHAEAEGLPELSDQVASLASSALESEEIQRAIRGRYWRELHVACPVGEHIIEGYVDLVYETDAGLVVVDYKTDQIDPSELGDKLERYRLQGATYATAIEETTQQPVARVVFVFLSPTSPALLASLPNLAEAIAEVRTVIEHEGAVGSHP